PGIPGTLVSASHVKLRTGASSCRQPCGTDCTIRSGRAPGTASRGGGRGGESGGHDIRDVGRGAERKLEENGTARIFDWHRPGRARAGWALGTDTREHRPSGARARPAAPYARGSEPPTPWSLAITSGYWRACVPELRYDPTALGRRAAASGLGGCRSPVAISLLPVALPGTAVRSRAGGA